jgi:site-specific DNA recombinase
MTSGDRSLPNYDPAENGITQDIKFEPLSSKERNARAARYTGNRKSLADKLNSDLRQLDLAPDGAIAKSNYCVIYLRVSSEEQARVGGTAEGYSIPYQREACRAKARELGLIVVGEYVDAGQSAKSANRPKLKKMLAELSSKMSAFVIVHKIDRLARNKRDDMEINDAIANAGASLVSVVEKIDDSPYGKFNYTIQAGLAQLYVDNLAVEVLKGLTEKAKGGGTPYRAPVGYLNKRRFEGAADIRWVEVDPERSPHIRWAFYEYATGNWSLTKLQEALTDRGLTTRPTPKRIAKPISLNGLHKVLTSPYYAGLVPYQGVYHEGQHPELVDIDTWLRVQDVLKAHNTAGEKDREHAHYLKGTVWCGSCGSRLIFSRNRGRHGGLYDYFFCIGRNKKRTSCTRKWVTVSAVEAGVEDFYKTFQINPAEVDAIRKAIHAELQAQRDDAQVTMRQATKRVTEVRGQRTKLLHAHYAGAVPQDMLKDEMQRLTVDLATAEREVRIAQASMGNIDQRLDDALRVAGRCAEEYANAPAAVRRLVNQGFFEKLLIDADGGVELADWTEPFRQLLGGGVEGDAPAAPGEADADPTVTTAEDTQTPPSAEPGGVSDRAPLAVALKCAFDGFDLENPTGRLATPWGSNNITLAEAEGFEPPDGCPSPAFKAASGCPGLFGLVRGCRCWLVRGAVPSQPVPDRCYTRRYTSSWGLAW